MSTLVKIIGDSTGQPTPLDGQYVVAWNSNVEFGTLEVTATPFKQNARIFDSLSEALLEWRAPSRIQPRRIVDGKPNRPLTALSITFEVPPKP